MRPFFIALSRRFRGCGIGVLGCCDSVLSGKRGRQTFFCTNTNWSLSFILETYARRWSIEVTFENMKQHLGFSDAANRTEKAVRRTAPMAGLLFSLIVPWFNKHGHKWVEFPDRPWYRRKQFPSFADMLTTLRRLSWDEMSAGVDCELGPNLTRSASSISPIHERAHPS